MLFIHFVSFLTLKMTGMGPDLFAFICLWGISAGSAILMKSGYNAVQVAFKNHEIDEKDHQHWSARTLFGAWLGTIISIPMAVFFCFMMIDTKVNLSITAVPTPELMAEMKYFLNEPNVEHSPVEFNGQEQEVVFYTEEAIVGANYTYFMEEKIPKLPTYEINKRNIEIDYLYSPVKVPLLYKNKRKCFLQLKHTSKNTNYNFQPVTTNFQNKFNLYAVKDTILADIDSYYEIRQNKNGYFCFVKAIGNNKVKRNEFRIISEQLTQYMRFPHVHHSIKTASTSTRKVISSWKELNNSFKDIAR